MALHPNFPQSPYAILDPAMRWFPADEALRDWKSSLTREISLKSDAPTTIMMSSRAALCL